MFQVTLHVLLIGPVHSFPFAHGIKKIKPDFLWHRIMWLLCWIKWHNIFKRLYYCIRVYHGSTSRTHKEVATVPRHPRITHIPKSVGPHSGLLYSLCPWLDELGAEGQLCHHFSRTKKDISLAGCLLAFTCPIDLTMKHLQGQDSACWHLPWQGMPRTYSWSLQTRNATSSIGGDVPTKLQPGLGLLCQEEDKMVRYSLSQQWLALCGPFHVLQASICAFLKSPWKISQG